MIWKILPSDSCKFISRPQKKKQNKNKLPFPLGLDLGPCCLFHYAHCQLWKSVWLSTLSQPGKTQCSKPPLNSPPFQHQQKIFTVTVKVESQRTTSQMRRNWGKKRWQIIWLFLKGSPTFKPHFLICFLWSIALYEVLSLKTLSYAKFSLWVFSPFPSLLNYVDSCTQTFY